MKTVFVTGSAKGLGKALVKYFASLKYDVVIHYNTSRQEAKTLQNELKAKGVSTLLVDGDLTDEKTVKKVFQKIKVKFGKLDVLINNVGSFIYKPITKTSFDEFKDVIESNVYSVFLCSKEAVHLMDESSQIINFGCASCDRLPIRKNTTPYYMAKTSIYYLTKLLAKELKVKVNMVSPGILESSIAPVDKDKIISFNDIIKAVNFLLSENANNINGANLEVAKGWIPDAD